MKKLIFSFTLLMSTAFFSVVHADIVNGNFENSFNNWTPTNGNNGSWSIIQDSQNQENMTNVLFNTQTGSGTHTILSDSFEVCTGDNVTLHWNMIYNDQGTGNSQVQINQYALNDPNGNGSIVGSANLFSSDTDGNENNNFSIDFGALENLNQFQGETVRIFIEHAVVGNVFEARWDNFRITGCDVGPEPEPVPEYITDGFAAPANQSAITVKKNRAIPLKVSLFGEDGLTILTPTDLVDDLGNYYPPVLQITMTSINPEEVIDISEESVSVGQVKEGNQFYYDETAEQWKFILKMASFFTSPGSYRVEVVSGNADMYTIQDPTASVLVIVK